MENHRPRTARAYAWRGAKLGCPATLVGIAAAILYFFVVLLPLVARSEAPASENLQALATIGVMMNMFGLYLAVVLGPLGCLSGAIIGLLMHALVVKEDPPLRLGPWIGCLVGGTAGLLAGRYVSHISGAEGSGRYPEILVLAVGIAAVAGGWVGWRLASEP